MNKKTKNLVLGILTVVAGVLLIVSYCVPYVLQYLIASLLLVVGLGIVVLDSIASKKILTKLNIVGAVLMGCAIESFVIGAIPLAIATIGSYILIFVGAILAADAILCFIQKRKNVVANSVELVLGLVAIALGLVGSIINPTLALIFCAVVFLLAGIVIILASVLDFNKYQKAVQKK